MQLSSIVLRCLSSSNFLLRQPTSFRRAMTTATLLQPPQQPPVWEHTPASISSETTRLIQEMKLLDDEIAQIPLDEATVENVILPIANLENIHAGILNQLSFYQHVSPSKELRDSSNESDSKIRKFSIESGLRQDVFKVIEHVYAKYYNSKTAGIDSETNKFILKIYNQYKRNGLSLPLEKRNEIKSIKEQLSQLAIKYSSNLSEDESFIPFKLEELDGVPQDVIDSFQTIEQDGETLYKMTFKYPDILPVLKYAKLESTRKAAFKGDQNKVGENSQILKDAVSLRSKLAKLLGYNNFSEYILEERMAKSKKNVLDFLNDLKVKLKPLAVNEISKLKELKGIGKDDDFYIWDQRFYNTKMLEEDYNVDDLKISQYFPMKSTINGMLSIYETIFKLKFIQCEDFSTWHEDVKQFQVWKTDDPENLQFVGYIYLDLHPRQGKYGHAANFGLVPGFSMKSGERNYPVTSLVCNFTNDTNGKPSLLKHNEVVTFFHELGHGIHDLMGLTKYSRFHGTSVAWDFVEMPSQLLEYFCWDKAILKSLSSHYETGESLPEDLIDSIIKSKHVNGALFNLRQLHFGLFDMGLHSTDDIESIDVDHLWNDLREEICLISNGGESFKGYGSFGHMMGGYQSGYYGYLWSQVFASDVFYSKFKSNPLDVENGVQYRDMILAKGGSSDESELLKAFLGRDPSNSGFLQELGLSSK